MPPFKKKSSAKKTKKKGKQVRDEWSHEGGINIQGGEGELEDDGSGPRKRRTTQDRDERFRRSRRKQHVIKTEREFVKKMSNRVKFDDILSSFAAAQGNEDDENDEDGTERKKVRQEPPPRNLTSAADRLARLMASNKKDVNNMEESEEEDMDDDEENEDDEEAEDSDEEAISAELAAKKANSDSCARIFGGVKLSRSLSSTAERDVDSDDAASDDEGAATTAEGVSAVADWYYQRPLPSGTEKRPKAVRVGVIQNQVTRGEDEIYARLVPEVISYSRALTEDPMNEGKKIINTVSKLGEIPGLPKMWRKNDDLSNLPLPPIASKLVPLLCTNADAFLEGRDEKNDDALLEACLLSTVLNVVRSRTRVVKHNQKLKQRSKLAIVKAAGGQSTEVVVEEGDDAPTEEALAALAAVEASTKPLSAAEAAAQRKAQRRANKRIVPQALPTQAVVSRLDEVEDDATQQAKEEAALKDQGFTRPRVLILCPYRKTALRVLHQLVDLLGPQTSFSGLEKFESEFSAPEEEEEIDNKTGKPRTKHVADKPSDWNFIFDGNMDDDFKVGIQINPGHGKGVGPSKGAYVRLFSDFYLSDIILASPLGLKLSIEREADKQKKSANKKKDVPSTAAGPSDFLSSIEQVVLHQADVMAMQNWDHVDWIMDHTNRLPKSMRSDTDFSRVRDYFLNGRGADYRQMMVTSSYFSPEFARFSREAFHSHSGEVRVKKFWGSSGVLSQVVNQTKQVFQLVPDVKIRNTTSTTPTSTGDLLVAQEDRRFEYFRDNVLRQIYASGQNRTLIFVPSYLDYVRLRNHLISTEQSAVFVCEYSRDSEISRARSRFYQGLKSVLVYSGRAHFFRRFMIRGARHLVFYAPPEYPHFYPELVNLLSASIDGNTEEESEVSRALTAMTLYSAPDAMALSRIVGASKAAKMLDGERETFAFF